MHSIYAVVDTVAGMIIGPLHLFRHDAAAVRMFGDVAALNGSIVGQHPADFELVCLGSLSEGVPPTIEAEASPRVIITGAAWAAAQQPAPEVGT